MTHNLRGEERRGGWGTLHGRDVALGGAGGAGAASADGGAGGAGINNDLGATATVMASVLSANLAQGGPAGFAGSAGQGIGEAFIVSARTPSIRSPWSSATMRPRAAIISSGSRSGVMHHAMNDAFRLAHDKHQRGLLGQADKLLDLTRIPKRLHTGTATLQPRDYSGKLTQ
jgi:hypothetical protein